MELENNEEGKGKGNKKRIAIIAVVVAALIAAGIAAFLLLSPHEPEASSIKDAATTTQEQLDEEAMKSRLWISVANTIYAGEQPRLLVYRDLGRRHRDLPVRDHQAR